MDLLFVLQRIDLDNKEWQTVLTKQSKKIITIIATIEAKLSQITAHFYSF